MSSNRRAEEHEEVSERWLLTYSDMITLLLALFVILFAISSVNKAKFAELKTNLRATFNGSTHSTAVSRRSEPPRAGQPSQTTTPPTTASPATINSVAAIEAQIEQALSAAGLLNDVQLSVASDGLTLGFVADQTFYSVDSAALSPIGIQIVDVAATVLRQHPNPISVDGYTDNEPITGGPYRDNWELSAERAVVVVEQLQNVGGVNPTQLYALSFGQYHPLVPNNSPAQQAENRRVNIVVSPLGQKVQLP